MSKRTIGMLLIAVVALGAMTGVAAADGHLEVAVDQDADGEPTVTVTENDTAVENASVNVTTVDGQNATYVGEGNYETDQNGTVTLDAAEENVTIDVTATYENDSVSTTVDLTAGGNTTAEEQPFGQLVQEFIKDLQDREGGIGAAISDFVTENNPGNAPDHAGQGNGSEQGPPDNAGPNGNDGDATNASDDDNRGPPSDAGPNSEAEGGEEDDGDDGGEGNDDDNAGNGPGNGNGQGNGNGPRN